MFNEESFALDGVLYIRDFYDELAELCINKSLETGIYRGEVNLTGTPGIGKSVFRNFVLFKLLTRAGVKKVVIVGAKSVILLFTVSDDGSVEVTKCNDFNDISIAFILHDVTAVTFLVLKILLVLEIFLSFLVLQQKDFLVIET